MSGRELRVEMLLGRHVTAANGRVIGRIEEIRAEARGTGAVVTAFLIGPEAVFERLSIPVLRLFGRGGGYLARPEQLDLADPDHPKLAVAVDALETLPGGDGQG
jgi:hypothetical protein